MEPVSNVDRLVLLLRQRLEERDRTRTSQRPGSTKTTSNDVSKSAVQALAATEGVDDRQFRRAVIQGLLTDRLGTAMMNDAAFQQVVDRVVGAIESDEETRKLLDRIANDLKAVAR